MAIEPDAQNVYKLSQEMQYILILDTNVEYQFIHHRHVPCIMAAMFFKLQLFHSLSAKMKCFKTLR